MYVQIFSSIFPFDEEKSDFYLGVQEVSGPTTIKTLTCFVYIPYRNSNKQELRSYNLTIKLNKMK